jgi:hypothetical protein
MIAINRGSPPSPWRIDVMAQLAQRCEPSPPNLPLRFQYFAEVQLGNPNDFEIEFDALVIGFRRTTSGSSIHDPVAQRTTWPSKSQIISDYFYDGTVEDAFALSGDTESKRQHLTIAGNRAVTFPDVPFGPQRAVDDAPGGLVLTIYITCDGMVVAPPLAGRLPDRSSIPVFDPWGKAVKRVRIPFVAVGT